MSLRSGQNGSLDSAPYLLHASWSLGGAMANSELLRIESDIILNISNVAYIKLTGKGRGRHSLRG